LGGGEALREPKESSRKEGRGEAGKVPEENVETGEKKGGRDFEASQKKEHREQIRGD